MDEPEIYKTNCGVHIFRCDNSIVARLPENRNVLTTSVLNGGYNEGLQAVFNHELSPVRGRLGHNFED